MPAKRNKRMLTRADVARIFSVTPSTVSRWSREGKLPSARTLGGQRRYVWDSVAGLAARAGIPGPLTTASDGSIRRRRAAAEEAP
jgi:predicted DNA-binding transcriptional regulator AlpA